MDLFMFGADRSLCCLQPMSIRFEVCTLVSPLNSFLYSSMDSSHQPQTSHPKVLCRCCNKMLSVAQERRHRRRGLVPTALKASALVSRHGCWSLTDTPDMQSLPMALDQMMSLPDRRVAQQPLQSKIATRSGKCWAQNPHVLWKCRAWSVLMKAAHGVGMYVRHL